jgi:hypothetical protein
MPAFAGMTTVSHDMAEILTPDICVIGAGADRRRQARARHRRS